MHLRLLASSRGHVRLVSTLIRLGVSVNLHMGSAVPGLGDVSPLYMAVHGGHEDVARLLIDAGADVDMVGRAGGVVRWGVLCCAVLVVVG